MKQRRMKKRREKNGRRKSKRVKRIIYLILWDFIKALSKVKTFFVNSLAGKCVWICRKDCFPFSPFSISCFHFKLDHIKMIFTNNLCRYKTQFWTCFEFLSLNLAEFEKQTNLHILGFKKHVLIRLNETKRAITFIWKDYQKSSFQLGSKISN